MWGAPVIEMIIGAPFMLGMDVKTVPDSMLLLPACLDMMTVSV